MENSTIQQKVATTTASVLIANANQNAEIHQILDQEATNTLYCGNQHRELVISIKEMVQSSLDPPLSSNKCCIYKIPTCLRKLNEEAYTPEVISIGPFHHGCERLEPMEKLKLKFFQRFLQRTGCNVEILVNAIKLNEISVRGCYAESIKLSSDDFVKLILVDGCFLIEFFDILCCQELESVIHVDDILLNSILCNIMMLDLKLLENQLPFSVLDRLFSLAYAPNVESVHHSFTSLAIKGFKIFQEQEIPGNLGYQSIRHFVDLTKAFLLSSSRKSLMPTQERNDCARSADQVRSCKCLLDLTRHFRNFVGLAREFFLRSCGKPVLSDESNGLPSATHLYTASQLEEAGVKFKVSLGKCLLDLKFTNGTLEIPRIDLYNDTETVYRNIIAFEQCHDTCDSDLTNYIVLLKLLINTPKDAELLIRKEIIINSLANSGAVASLFHNLDTNMLYDPKNSTYRRLFQDLNAFYRNTKHTWKATLKRDYFGTPWKIASTVAAVTLLLLTLGQFICSIIQLVKM